MSYDANDPLAGGSNPSVSWKDKAPGAFVTGTVTEAPKLVQSRDFETGEPAFWPAGRDGSVNQKMSVVLGLEIDGEPFSVWAQKPSAMFAALGKAQQEAGQRIAEGDTLTITYTGDKPNENPRLNAAKQYSAKIVKADAFATEPAAAHNQQPYVAQQQPAAQTQAAAPGDFAAKGIQVRGLAAAGLDANQIAAVPGIGLDAGTIQAILNAS